MVCISICPKLSSILFPFATNIELKHNFKVHLREKPYKCQECETKLPKKNYI